MKASGAGLEDLIQALRKNLSQPQGVERQIPDRSAAELHRTYGTAETLKMEPLSQRVSLKLDNLILNAVANIPVISLAELRREMPAEYQGKVFDEAVLRLADEQKVFISQDVNPARFSVEEKADYVQDGDIVFTTIAKWN